MFILWLAYIPIGQAHFPWWKEIFIHIWERERERVQKAAIFEFQATILKLKVLSFFYG